MPEEKNVCANCHYHEKKEYNSICKRKAPIGNDKYHQAVWPIIIPYKDWCGEYTIKE